MTILGHAIWLYGSHARGNVDHLSDLDVLVVSSSIVSLEQIERETRLSLTSASVSHYSWDEVRKMAAYGSLFLHHLRIEGRVMYESPACEGAFRALLSEMGRYRYANRDLDAFQQVLSDVSTSLKSGGVEAYELSVLATVIRHCSILGCWLIGSPEFGRIEPVDKIVTALQLDVRTAAGYADLYSYRLYMDNRISQTALTACQPDSWLNRAYALIENVRVLSSERNKKMLETD